MKKLLFVLIIAAVSLYFSLGIIAKNVIESQVQRETGVPLQVGFVSIKPFSGTATISGIAIANPEKFTHYDEAFSLAEIDGEVYLDSLFNNPLHVKHLHIKNPEIFVEMVAGQNNLLALKEQVQKAAPPTAKQAPKQTEGEFKLIIDELVIEGAAIHLAAGVVPAGEERRYDIETIKINHIGKQTNGADIANVTGIVIAEIQKHTDGLPRRILFSSLGDLSKKLISLPLDALKAAPGAIIKAPGVAIDTIKNAPGNVIDGVKSGADAVGGLLPFGGSEEKE